MVPRATEIVTGSDGDSEVSPNAGVEVTVASGAAAVATVAWPAAAEPVAGDAVHAAVVISAAAASIEMSPRRGRFGCGMNRVLQNASGAPGLGNRVVPHFPGRPSRDCVDRDKGDQGHAGPTTTR